jgi:hypothetical protein
VLGFFSIAWRLISWLDAEQRETQETARSRYKEEQATIRALANGASGPGELKQARERIELLSALFKKLQVPLPELLTKLAGADKGAADVRSLAESIEEAKGELNGGIGEVKSLLRTLLQREAVAESLDSLSAKPSKSCSNAEEPKTPLKPEVPPLTAPPIQEAPPIPEVPPIPKAPSGTKGPEGSKP